MRPVGIVQRDNQVLHRQSRDPGVGRGVQMHQHPDHRAAFAPSPVLPARWLFLYRSRLLQHQPKPVVRDLDPVLLGDLLVKVPHREVSIHVALEPAQKLDGRSLDSPPTHGAPTAPFQHRLHFIALDHPPDTSHVPFGDSQHHRRLAPG
jgi:hypothetical protein